MQVKIKNWRCIKEVEFDLSKINIFLGQNATGKSSLAYALYLLSKSPKLGVEKTLNMLYGLDYKSVVRVENGKPCYPVEITAGTSFVKIEERGVLSISAGGGSSWNDEYLLPSRRVTYFQALRFLPKLAEEIQKKPDSKALIPFVIGFLKPIIEELPLFPPAQVFFLDLNRALTGYKIEPIKGSLKSLGDYIIVVSPLMSLYDFYVYDPFTNHKIPAEIAPDGQVDQMLIDLILEKSLENSLVVIEEPEIYKNPVFQFEMMEKISELALSKNLTVVMTTHSEILPLSIAKLIENGSLTVDDVRIYYLMRSKEEPWTTIKKIDVYEDGTLEELPDSEKITAQLF
jgi:energy-coupling factor transporter ATP-binding protein EcfA2